MLDPIIVALVDNVIHHYLRWVNSNEYYRYVRVQNEFQNELKPNGVQFLQYDQIL